MRDRSQFAAKQLWIVIIESYCDSKNSLYYVFTYSHKLCVDTKRVQEDPGKEREAKIRNIFTETIKSSLTTYIYNMISKSEQISHQKDSDWRT